MQDRTQASINKLTKLVSYKRNMRTVSVLSACGAITIEQDIGIVKMFL